MTPNDCYLLLFTPLCDLLRLVWARPCDLLLRAKVIRMSLLRLGYKKVRVAISLALSNSSYLFALTKPAAMLRHPLGKEKGVASGQQPAKNWGPERNWILPMATWVNLEEDPLPDESWDEAPTQLTPQSRSSARPRARVPRYVAPCFSISGNSPQNFPCLGSCPPQDVLVFFLLALYMLIQASIAPPQTSTSSWTAQVSPLPRSLLPPKPMWTLPSRHLALCVSISSRLCAPTCCKLLKGSDHPFFLALLSTWHSAWRLEDPQWNQELKK